MAIIHDIKDASAPINGADVITISTSEGNLTVVRPREDKPFEYSGLNARNVFGDEYVDSIFKKIELTKGANHGKEESKSTGKTLATGSVQCGNADQ